MPPNLKPLLLPQLVEQRRLLELQKTDSDGEVHCVFSMEDASTPSDVGSPITPTFSQRGHLRYSSSSSSLELLPPSSSCADSPASPTQLAHSTKSSKRPLPDVQEDPLERDEDEDTTPFPDHVGLYDCLCDEPCTHHDVDMPKSAVAPPHSYEFDYDLGFLSDGDFSTSPRSAKKRRGGSDSPLAGLTARIRPRLSMSRWRANSRRANLGFMPGSETTLDQQRPSLSRAPSSRSSSFSAPGRQAPDRSNESPLPPTPALSFYEVSDSVVPAPLDIEQANVRLSLERDRAMATTPLLPPLMTEKPPSSRSQSQQPSPLQPSPLQSPTIAPVNNSAETTPPPQLYPSPPLSTKPSISSFRPITGSTNLSAPSSSGASEISSPIPNFSLLEHHDVWSDRLGHANFTILPKPYHPDTADLEALAQLRTHWDLARINYTKHLVRTGEHYGTTSNTYALTELKWAETERAWRTAHDQIVDCIAAGGASNEGLQWQRLQDAMPAAVPRMLDAEGKFPELGDEDIVGPMVRDAVMVREGDGEERGGAARFWKSLAGKLGRR